jgi:hypothetical protein
LAAEAVDRAHADDMLSKRFYLGADFQELRECVSEGMIHPHGVEVNQSDDLLRLESGEALFVFAQKSEAALLARQLFFCFLNSLFECCFHRFNKECMGLTDLIERLRLPRFQGLHFVLKCGLVVFVIVFLFQPV